MASAGGLSETLKHRFDLVRPGAALQEAFGGRCHGLEDGRPLFQNILRVLPVGDVAAYRVILEDVPLAVENGPVAPLVPEQFAERVHHPAFRGTHGALGIEVPQLGKDLLSVQLGDGKQNVSVLEILPLTAEIPAVGLIDVGETAVGSEPANYFRLFRGIGRPGKTCAVRDLVERTFRVKGISLLVVDILHDFIDLPDRSVLALNPVPALSGVAGREWGIPGFLSLHSPDSPAVAFRERSTRFVRL